MPQYKNNHYVPVWYQKRFLPPGQVDQELFYLDLKPEPIIDPRGIAHPRNPIRRLGFNHCFAQNDLYITSFGNEISTRIEQFFFGEIDNKGRQAVDYFTNFAHPSINEEAYNNIMIYMSTQKLRTPKGLNWLSNKYKTTHQNALMHRLLQLRQLYGAIWTECIWQIADASQSNTRFIISDHPITVYNRVCGPSSHWCRGSNDPDIRFHATHTIFPLTLNKVLILTNLSWVRNPFQKEISMRPNPSFFRPALFKFQDIQTLRSLNEQEVREINFIIKSRAYRYIGAARKEWLYPDRYISKSQWNTYGNGFLLMPDPRPIYPGGDVVWGTGNTIYGAIDEYGRSPDDPSFSMESKKHLEFKTLEKFKGIFAYLYGPKRRGRSFKFSQLDPETDSDEQHKYHLSLERKNRKYH